MKTSPTRSLLLVCSFSLLALPAAFAGDAGKKLDKLDTNDDGQVSRAEHAAGAQAMFAKLDVNGDGVVTESEVEAKKDMRPEEKNRDEQKDHISRDEKKHTDEKFKLMDRNNDGRITAEENTAVASAMFDAADTNRDGQLSKGELEAAHQAMKK